MKKTMMYTVSLLLVMLMVAPVWVFAQNQEQLQKFSNAELDQMLAPIALYPDSLLAQILMAATYPLEVVMADRWVKAHPNLRGDQLNTELDNQSWDPSVKALVPFPQVLVMMSEKLEWTEKLGDAFLDQQEEVMDTVQRLREKAQEAGNLKTTREQQVLVRERIIVIEPANPEVVYVPVYNPTIVYGPWWYPAYPPFWYYPPGYVVARVVFAFPFFYVVGPAWPFAWGHWDWPHHRVYVNVNRTININRTYISHADIRTTTWHHDASHRRGVAYRSEPIRERYTPTKGSVDSRRDFRGFDQGVKTAPKVSSKPPTIQQPPLSGRPGSDRLRGGTVSSGPPVIQQPQGAGGSGSNRPGGSKVSSAPPIIQQSQPQESGNRTQAGSKVSGAPPTIQQPKGSGGSDRTRLQSSKDRTVFGSIDRGSEVKRQSERGALSRASTTRGESVGGSGSSHGVGLTGGGPGAGTGKGSSGGSGQQNGGKGGFGGSGPSGGDHGGSKAKDDIRH
jgi:hypothetical protein